MKKITQASSSPHYVFKPDSLSVAEATFVTVKNFLNKKELGWIEKYVKTIDMENAKTGGGDNSGLNPEKRKGKVGWIQYNLDTRWLYDKIFEQACNNPWDFDVTGIHDSLQYTLYPTEVGDSYYKAHRDAGPQFYWRKISMTIQLSDPDDFEGGGVEIEDPGGNQDWIKVPHEDRGDMVVFPSIMRHRALPVTKGTRKALIVWVSGPPLR
jgi:PKHD-type hydroxylase